MEIKVIGTNSSNRIKLIKNIKKATDNNIANLMLYSSSPQGRRLFEKLLVGDPYNIDIKLVEKDNRYNITNTPALVINDKIISQGKVLNEREIKKFIEVLA